MNWVIRNLAVTESTNDDAKKAAEGGEAEGLVIHALKQTAGRGRQGRAWESPEGNLYCSLLLRPKCEPKDFSHYAFVAALAIYDVVSDYLKMADKPFSPHRGEKGWDEGGDRNSKSNSPPHPDPDPLPLEGGEGNRVTLKWPNDVLADGRKISGVLLESGPGWLVAGIGLNLTNHPDGGLYPATSLHALGAPKTNPKTALEKLLERFDHWQGILRKDGFAPIRAAWLERASAGRMMVKLPQGNLEGIFVGLAADGALRLKLADGSERAIATGDVFPVTGH